MLQGDYLSVLEAKDQDQFRSVVIRFAQSLGFETVSAMVAVDHVGAAPEFVAVPLPEDAATAVTDLVDDVRGQALDCSRATPLS